MDKLHRRRHQIQALGAVALNGNILGFIRGQIHQGASKNVCVPALNCYSCPGALGSCPIGSLQAIAGSPGFHLSLYVIGLIVFFGVTAGRFFCGYVCPFGFFQDLINRLPIRNRRIPPRLHRFLSYGKYIMLFGVVLLLPALLKDRNGFSDPYFCKYICPSGTLGAGLPLLAANQSIRGVVGLLFSWKLAIALILLGFVMIIPRFFCRYLCPLGAAWGLLHPVSLYRYDFDEKTCIDCGLCRTVCPVQIDPTKTPNSPDCIRCRACIRVCPTAALSSSVGLASLKMSLEKKENSELL